MAREDDSSMEDTDIAAVLARGVAALEDARHGDAEAAFRAVLAREPDNADALRRLGAIAFMGGRHDDAFGLLELSISLAPDNADAHNNLAAILQARGETSQAEMHFRRALELTPDDGDIHFNLGLILLERGNRAAARLCFEDAVRLLPDDADAYYNLGLAARGLGDAPAALAAQHAAIARDPKHAGALLDYAVLLREQGRLGEALPASKAALAENRNDGEAAFNHGVVLSAHDRRQDAITHFQRAIAAGYNAPDVQNYLGLAQAGAGQLEAASRSFQRGLDQAPGDAELTYNLRQAHARAIPTWPLQLFDDRVRNAAYRAAIERAVKPGDTVLVIGAGMGLVAMMAARAGAGKVIACEPLPVLAALVRRVVARNGLEDRVTVVNNRAELLEIGESLPAPADVIVAENISDTLIGDNLLPALYHAKRHLARPDARVIPARATVWGVLIEWPDPRANIPAGDVEGFDCRDIDVFRNAREPVAFDWARESHRVLSQPFALAALDFTDPVDLAPIRGHDIEALEAGVAHAVVTWFDLDLDDQCSFSTRGETDFNRWHSMAYRLANDLPVRRGGISRVTVQMTDNRFYFVDLSNDGDKQ